MGDQKTNPAAVTKTGTQADKSTSNAVPGDRALSKAELDNVAGGINPQPLPPRTGGEPPIVVDRS